MKDKNRNLHSYECQTEWAEEMDDSPSTESQILPEFVDQKRL